MGKRGLSVVVRIGIMMLALSGFTFSVEEVSAQAGFHFSCSGSGEITGNHPGWASNVAQRLNLSPRGNSTYEITWCPASAPNGVGQISYTVTSSLGAITCETTALSCVMKGVSSTSKFWLMASDETGSYMTESLAVANSGVPLLCKKTLLQCNTGPSTKVFPTYGNTAPLGAGNCTFAAVANWEQIVLGIRADPAVLKVEFEAAGGNNNLGLTTDQVFNYWKTFGIAGVYAESWKSVPVDPLSLMNSIDNSEIGVVIASINLTKNQNFAGTSNPNSSYHWVVVDGYTPQGPLVVSWGQTLQMTWQQWNLESVTTWQITTMSGSKRT